MTQQLPPDLRWIAFDLAGDLASAYRTILQAAQSEHLSQPKTSREYRAERFERLLGEFGRIPGRISTGCWTPTTPRWPNRSS